jgi:hypothetical protein
MAGLKACPDTNRTPRYCNPSYMCYMPAYIPNALEDGFKRDTNGKKQYSVQIEVADWPSCVWGFLGFFDRFLEFLFQKL